MRDNRVIAVSVFYRNDEPTGFGCTVHPEYYDAIKSECETVWQEFKADGETDDAIAGILIDQLNGLGEVSKDQLTTAQQCLAVMNIILLSEHGFLANNDFNGLLFVRNVGSDVNGISDAIFS